MMSGRGKMRFLIILIEFETFQTWQWLLLPCMAYTVHLLVAMTVWQGQIPKPWRLSSSSG